MKKVATLHKDSSQNRAGRCLDAGDTGSVRCPPLDNLRGKGALRRGGGFSVFGSRVGFAAGSGEPGHKDGYLVQQDQRSSQQKLGKNVRRGDQGGDDEVGENGVFAPTPESGGGDDAEFGEEKAEQRHLEHDAESKHELEGIPVHVGESDQGHGLAAAVPDEEIVGKRDDHKETECSSGDEEQGGAERHWDHVSAFRRIQTGGDEGPYLIKYIRAREKEAENEGQVHVHHERFGHVCKGQSPAGWKGFLQRGADNAADERGKRKQADEAHENADDTAQQPSSKLGQVSI